MGVPNPPPPDHVTFTIWAYKLTDGKWVKSDEFCWTTQDPIQAWEYMKKINAVSGWCATTNCPPIVPKSQRFYEGGLAHGCQTVPTTTMPMVTSCGTRPITTTRITIIITVE